MTDTMRTRADGPVESRRHSRVDSPVGGRAARAAIGKAARGRAPLPSLGDLDAAPDRDPVGLLLRQDRTRVLDLVPVRHGRMLASPFAFYRGAAIVMAGDLARTPASGLHVQLCGDAHLANFGAFASPERRLVFDLNDFDETLPGPFEWDVKRLVASFEIAARENGYTRKERRRIVLAVGRGYREAMRGFADMSVLTLWYAHLDVEDALERYRADLPTSGYKAMQGLMVKARKRDSTQALGKLTSVVDGRRRIISDPPLVVPVRELFPEMADDLFTEIRTLLSSYERTLNPNRRHLLRQFELVDIARKVVGVGSVGTAAWILLLEADGGSEYLFLQAKEAQESVLAEHVGQSDYAQQGERVVTGQRLMQAVSDIFLGWQRTTGVDGVDRDYYVRQLRDWKLSVPIEQMHPVGMRAYADLSTWTLARAHARTGDRFAIAAYLGGSDKFDHAMLDFAEAYADLNETDHAALATAVADGRVRARTGV